MAIINVAMLVAVFGVFVLLGIIVAIALTSRNKDK